MPIPAPRAASPATATTRRNCRRQYAIVIVLALLSSLAADGAPAAELAVDVSVRGERGVIGRDLVLDVTLTPPSGTLLVADAIEITVSGRERGMFFSEPYPLRPTTAPAAGTEPLAYRGPTRFEWAAPLPADLAPFTAQLEVVVRARDAAGVEWTGRWTGAVPVAFGDEWSADRIRTFIDSRGFVYFLPLVFGFGLLMSLSPCIYPMIPITLAVIGARSQERGAAHGLLLSVTYVVGMALVYAILGALSATVFSGITAVMQSPWVLAPLAVLLLLLAFSMFGAYELQAPAFLRDRLQGPGGARGGLFGVFAMGMVAGLVASPCVGPFLAALLVWVATTGNWVWGFFSLFTFGLGMGMLLIGVGTFPALLGGLPSSGGWMETVKKGMGLLLVAMAFYFVRPGAVLPPHVFFPLLGVAAILTAVFMGAFDRPAAESGWWPRTSKGLGLVVFAAGMYFLVGSFVQHGFVMPSPLGRSPARATSAEPPRTGLVATTPPATTAAPDAAGASGDVALDPLPDKVEWELIRTGENALDRLEAQLAAARAAGQPVMIDFWAEWCIYCKKLDKSVWNVPAVVAESQRFTTIKIDATAPDDAEMEIIKERYRVPGLPRVVFVDSRGEILHGRSSGYKAADEMLNTMQSVR